jgi:hypothetical protein
MPAKIINILLILIVVVLLSMDGMVIYDLFTEETDMLYEIGMILISIVVFIAILVYLNQRNKIKSTQIEGL